MSKKKIPIVVKVSHWARQTKGVDKGESALLNDYNNMCCLGFACRALGYKPGQIRFNGFPSYYLEEGAYTPEERELVRVEKRAAKINDDEATSDAVKKTKLRALFAKTKHFTIKFVP